MANIRDEHLKNAANWLNSLSASVFTVGVIAPISSVVLKIGPPAGNEGLIQGFTLVCIVIAVVLHSIGHLAIAFMDETQ